jgi:hypothetical protein
MQFVDLHRKYIQPTIYIADLHAVNNELRLRIAFMEIALTYVHSFDLRT